MKNESHRKGDIALGKVVSDLLIKGWHVFLPVSTHACPYDLLAEFEGRIIRVQVKFGGFTALEKYDKDSFEYIAVYNANYNVVSYLYYPAFILSNAKSIKLSYEKPNSATPFYWHKDFSEVLEYLPKKRKLKHGTIKRRYKATRKSKSKISLKELQRLVWKRPVQQLQEIVGMSDVAIIKMCRRNGIIQPPSGYWNSRPITKKKTKARYKKAVMDRYAEL